MTVGYVLVRNPSLLCLRCPSVDRYDIMVFEMRCQLFFILFDALPQAVFSPGAEQWLDVTMSGLLLTPSTRSAHLDIYGT